MISATIAHVILDRDGVLNRELATGWLSDPTEWSWEPGSLMALRRLARLGVSLSIVSNQSGIGRGEISHAAVDRLHQWLENELEAVGVKLSGIWVCPHAPEAMCDCRKPAPGLVRRAVESVGVPAERTLMIGDDLRDLEAGRAASVHVALVRTGKGERVAGQLDADTLVFDNLLAAVPFIAEGLSSLGANLEETLLQEHFEEHSRVFEATRKSQLAALESAAKLAEACLLNGGKILVFGNGGSAADAQHFAAELEGRFEVDRPALAAVALTVNTSTLTAVSNDYGFDTVFRRQVEALGKPGDLALAISTSGNSPNVIAAARAAQARGLGVIGLTGEGGGALAEHCDVLVAVPTKTVSRIQEMHELCLHALASWLERRVPAGESGEGEA